MARLAVEKTLRNVNQTIELASVTTLEKLSAFVEINEY
jgi:hypothetical protein